MPDFYSVWTDTGLQKVGAAATAGQPFSMPTAVVGDGGGVPVIPNKGMTALVRQVWSGAVGSITRSKSDPNTCVYEFCIPASDGPFTVREVGLKDAAGALCILGNFPETDKPVAANGSVRDMVIRIPVHFENADSVTLVVDSLTIASNEDVDRKITAHNEHGEAHPDIRDNVIAKFNAAVAKAYQPGDEIMLPYVPSTSEMNTRRLLERNGASLLRTDYSGLFSKIGTMYGAVDSLHFNLPDDRGLFMRIWDHGAGVDPNAASRTDRGDGSTGDAVGTAQLDAIRSHRHTYPFHQNADEVGASNFPFPGGAHESPANRSGAVDYFGDNETRPKNRCKWGGIFY